MILGLIATNAQETRIDRQATKLQSCDTWVCPREFQETQGPSQQGFLGGARHTRITLPGSISIHTSGNLSKWALSSSPNCQLFSHSEGPKKPSIRFCWLTFVSKKRGGTLWLGILCSISEYLAESTDLEAASTCSKVCSSSPTSKLLVPYALWRIAVLLQ